MSTAKQITFNCNTLELGKKQKTGDDKIVMTHSVNYRINNVAVKQNWGFKVINNGDKLQIP